jgi:glycine amidinotransferase
VEGATIPEWHVSGKAVWPPKHWDMFRNKSGQPFPRELMVKAQAELDGFAKILEAEGVTVRRPDVTQGDFSQPYSTPDFKASNGLYAAMPRGITILVTYRILMYLVVTIPCCRCFDSSRE